jgi:hypothetical protein
LGIRELTTALLCAALFCPLAASAQPQGDATPPVPAHAVPAGSIVDVEIAETVSSKVQKIGDTFAIRLANPILQDSKVVVPAGTTGVGQIVEAAPAGMFGTPAKLLLAARYLDFKGAQIKLRTLQLGRVGTDNTNAVMAMSFIPYVGLASLFVHGGEIEIPAGTRAQAKLVADLEIPAASPGDVPPTADPKPPTEGPKQP